MPDINTVVVTPTVSVVAVNSSVPGSYDSVGRLGLGWFNVVEYGATGDGSTDDTTAIQSAVTAAVAAGGVVYFAPTTAYYKLTAAITVTGACQLTGPGEVRQTTANTAAFSVGGGVDDVTFEGLTIRGDSSAAGPKTANGNGIIVVGTSAASPNERIVVRGCTISGFSQIAVFLEWVKHFEVVENRLSDCAYGGVLTFSCQYGQVSGNDIYDIGDETITYGIIMSRRNEDSLVTHPRSADIVVTENVVDNVAYWEGIDTHGGERLTIANNVVTGCFNGIVVIEANDGSGTSLFPPLDVAVIGNIVDSQVTDGTAGRGIIFSGADATHRGRGSVRGNLVTGHGTATTVHHGGIVVLYATVDVSDNRMVACSPHGVVCYTDSQGSTVRGCTAVDPWSDTIVNAAAVHINDASGDVDVSGTTLARGDKSATYVAAAGVYTIGTGITLHAHGNDFSAATVAAYVDTSTTTKEPFEAYGAVKGRGLTMRSRAVTATTDSPTSDDYEINYNATSNSITATLPLAANNAGVVLVLKRIDVAAANTVTIVPSGAETIDGVTSLVLPPTRHPALVVLSDGSIWRILSWHGGYGDTDGIETVTGAGSAALTTRTVLGDGTSGAVSVSLPVASTARGRRITLVKTDSTTNTVSLTRSSTNTIAGLTDYIIKTQYETVTVESDGVSTWYVVGRSGARTWSAKTGTYTVANNDDGLFLGGASWTLTLQSAATRFRPLTLRCTASGTITIARAGSDTIEGSSSSITMVAGEKTTLMPNGTDWLVVA